MHSESSNSNNNNDPTTTATDNRNKSNNGNSSTRTNHSERTETNRRTTNNDTTNSSSGGGRPVNRRPKRRTVRNVVERTPVNSRVTNVFVIEGEDDDSDIDTKYSTVIHNSHGRNRKKNSRRRKNSSSSSNNNTSDTTARNENSKQSGTTGNIRNSNLRPGLNRNRGRSGRSGTHRSNRSGRSGRSGTHRSNRSEEISSEVATYGNDNTATITGNAVTSEASQPMETARSSNESISHQSIAVNVTSLQPVQVLVSPYSSKHIKAQGTGIDSNNQPTIATASIDNDSKRPTTIMSVPSVHSIASLIDKSDDECFNFHKSIDEIHSDEEFVDFTREILEANIFDDGHDDIQNDNDYEHVLIDTTSTTISPSLETTEIGVTRSTLSETSDHSKSDATTTDFLLMDVVNSMVDDEQMQFLSFVDCFMSAGIDPRSNNDIFSSNNEDSNDNNESHSTTRQTHVSASTTSQHSIESAVPPAESSSQSNPLGGVASSTTMTTTPTLEKNTVTRTRAKKSKAQKTHVTSQPKQSIEEMNMERCQQIVQHQATISNLKKEVIKLQQEHTKMQLLASLSCPKRSITIWNSLQKQEKWRKINILTLLRSFKVDEKADLPDTPGLANSIRDEDIDMIEARHKHYLPSGLKEGNWEQNVPPKIKHDKDIFLARIATYHFRHHYSISCQNTSEVMHEYYLKASGLVSIETSTNTIPGKTSAKAKANKRTSKNSNQQEKSVSSEKANKETNSKTKKNKHNNRVHLEWSDEQQSRLPKSFVIPKPFWNDPEVMQAIVYHFPEVLLFLTSPHWSEASPNSLSIDSTDSESNNGNSKAAYSIWSDDVLFQQFIRSPYVCRTKMLKMIIPSLIEKFHPITIRQNRNLMLLAIKDLSWHCFEYVHPLLFDDKEFVLEVFMLHRGDNIEPVSCGPSQVLHFESTKDCCRLMPSSLLSKCSASLRKDIDVVLAAVEQNGLALQYASISLRRHYRVIMQACLNDPIAFVYAPPSDARTKLQGKKDFWLNIIFRKLESECHVVQGSDNPQGDETLFGQRLRSNDGIEISRPHDDTDQACFSLPTLWALVPELLKKDECVIKAAIKAGCLHINETPTFLRENENFWMEMVRHDSNFWYNLPPKFQKDAKFVVEGIQKFESQDLVVQIFHRFENLRSNRSIWERIIRSIELRSDIDDEGVLDFHFSNPFLAMNIFAAMVDAGMTSSCLHDLIISAPAVISENKELMIEACKREPNIYPFLQFPLSEDRDIIHATLSRTPQAIKNIRPDLQRQYPDLIAEAIKALPPTDLWDYYSYIDEDLWSDCREVALAWVSSGGDYLHDEFPVEYEKDAEIFLHVAKHNPHDFWCASESLCNNKEYMKKVVEINGELLHEAWSGLSRDYDLTTIALASTRDLPNRYDITDPEDFNFITSIAKHIRKQIQESITFQNLILCSISLGPKDESAGSCKLPLLDQGDETALVYKKLIFEYIGLPTGKDLQILRKASANLAVWGY